MTDHMFVLDPPRRHWTIKMWSPWKCVCGVGGTGHNDEAAEYQYNLHLLGAWPAYMGWVPGTHPFITPDGRVVFVKDDE